MSLEKMKNAKINEKDVQELEVKEINGVLMTKEMSDNWDKIWNFQAKPNDLLIASYLRSGTTWTQEIIDMIQNEGDEKKCQRTITPSKHPHIEWTPPLALSNLYSSGVEQAVKMSSPRTMKTSPCPAVTTILLETKYKSKINQIIYVARNAKDNVVSYYHLSRTITLLPKPGTFEEFTEKFMNGRVLCGSWYDHVKGWWDKKDKHPILYLFYEDMKENPKREIQKILKFLEKDLSEEILNKIIYHTSFDIMKENPMTNPIVFPRALQEHSISTFIRKGMPGDWKNHFTVAQNEKFDENYKKKMAGTTLTFRTEI